MAMRLSLWLPVFALLVAATAAPAQEEIRAGNPEPAAAAPHKAAPKAKRHVKTAKKPAPPAPAKSAKTKSAEKAAKPAAKPVKLKPVGPKLVEPKTEATSEPAKTDPPAVPVAALPAAERLKIQAALAWAGDLSAPANGEDPLTAAIKSFQKRSKAPVTGELTAAQRAALLAAAGSYQSEYGWTVVTDPATGIRVGLPSKMVPQVHDAAHGTRWSSAHGEFQIETFRIKNPRLALAALFDQQKREAGRKVDNSALHEDNFFVSGMQGLKYFSVRAQMRDGELRGITIMYDQAWEGIVAAVTGAVASAYAPFPERSTSYAALAKSVEYGTALIVSAQGHLITTRRLVEGCQVIVAPGLGDAEPVAEDEAAGLALLRVYGRGKLEALALAPEPAKTGELMLVGIADPKEQKKARELTEVKARLTGGAIELERPVPVAGLAGAAALDAQGRVLGIMTMRGMALASAEPAAASPVRLVGAGAIRNFLTAHHVALAAADAGDARKAVVRIICVRK